MAFLYDILTFITTRIAIAYLVFPFVFLEFWPSLETYAYVLILIYIIIVVLMIKMLMIYVVLLTLKTYFDTILIDKYTWRKHNYGIHILSYFLSHTFKCSLNLYLQERHFIYLTVFLIIVHFSLCLFILQEYVLLVPYYCRSIHGCITIDSYLWFKAL